MLESIISNRRKIVGETVDYARYKENSAAWYRRRLERGGKNVEVLSSGNDDRRAIRFDVLKDVGVRPGCSVLDVGCGFADFYAHLKSSGIDVDYTGVDIVSDFVRGAKTAHAGIKVEERDILERPFEKGSFDFVVSSQVLNLRLEGGDNAEIAEKMLAAMRRTAREGVACDFVTDYVDFKEDYLFYHSPEKMFKAAKKLTKRVVLRHDYPLFEFCLYLYPDFESWNKAK